MPLSRFALGIDIGGTFTDLVLMDREGGATHRDKILTTPNDPVAAVGVGVERLLARTGLPMCEVEAVIHATTLATNTIIQGNGARIGLITTEGFRDVLETGREGRYNLYDLQILIPPPLADRPQRITVRERTTARGDNIQPLAAGCAREAARQLRELDVEAVAVCFLHSYENALNEEVMEDALLEELPGIPVSLSSRVLPVRGEFVRLSTTVINSYVQPVVSDYLLRFAELCLAQGFQGPAFIMMSNGGMTSVQDASAFPVRIMESGPAAGTIAAARRAGDMEIHRVISFDMGGTTAKACVIEDQTPTVADHLEVARLERFAIGSGYPLGVPSVNLLEIGAGGGSIAWVNSMGLLQVGPDSSGADPGPASYGAGGTRPTVTDADLVLGFLNSDYFLGGTMKLDIAAARNTIENHLTGPLGRPIQACSWGVYDVVNENMARAIRLHSVEQGMDPREFTLMAFGGAGPVHACAVALKLGISRVVFPLGAGTESAFGLVVAPLVVETVQTHADLLERADVAMATQIFESLVERGAASIALELSGLGTMEIQRSVDVRILGQSYIMTVPVPGGRRGPSDMNHVTQTFTRQYEKLFERPVADTPIEVVNWRVRLRRDPDISVSPDDGSRAVARSANKGSRTIALGPNESIDASVYDRYSLTPTDFIAGPAIIEESETTVVLPPEFHAQLDPTGNLVAVKGSSPIRTAR